jgi:tetratricopeptide (TPR) repeat protein
VDLHVERLAGFDRTTWHASGTAVRAVDRAGRMELGTRSFGDRAGRLGAWVLLFLVMILMSALPKFHTGAYRQRPGESRGAAIERLFRTVRSEDARVHMAPGSDVGWFIDYMDYQHVLGALGVRRRPGAVAIGFAYIWPILLALCLIALRWPQWARPTAWSVNALLLGSALDVAFGPIEEVEGMRRLWRIGAPWDSIAALAPGAILSLALGAVFGLVLPFAFGRFIERRANGAYQIYRGLALGADGREPSFRMRVERVGFLLSGLQATIFVAMFSLGLFEMLLRSEEVVGEARAEAACREARRAQEAGRPWEAAAHFERALQHFGGLLASHPDDPTYHSRTGAARNDLALLLISQSGSLERARTLAERAIADQEAALRVDPGNATYRRFLGNHHDVLARVLNRLPGDSEWSAIEWHWRRAEELYEALLADRPDDVALRSIAGTVASDLGDVLRVQGDYPAAREAYKKAITAYEPLVRARPAVLEYRSRLGGMLNNLGLVLHGQGRYEAAVERFREAIGHQRTVFERAPGSSQYRQFLSNHYSGLGTSLRAMGRIGEAVEATRERTKLWPGEPDQLYAAAGELALCLPALGRQPARLSPVGASLRERLAGEAVSALRQAVAAGYRDLARLRSDTSLEPLRSCPEFQLLMMDLAMPAQPFARAP